MAEGIVFLVMWLLQMTVVAVFGCSALFFLIVVIWNWKNKGRFRKFGLLFLVTLIAAFGIYKFDLARSLSYYESTDREDLVPIFTKYFGFNPTQEVKLIAGGTTVFFDGYGEWLEFSCDEKAFSRIMSADTELEKLEPGTAGYKVALSEIESLEYVEWSISVGGSRPIYTKSNSAAKNFGSFYLWTNGKQINIAATNF